MSAFTRLQLERTIKRLEAKRVAMVQEHRPHREIEYVSKTLEIVRRRLETEAMRDAADTGRKAFNADSVGKADT